jgi:hypothetical protein
MMNQAVFLVQNFLNAATDEQKLKIVEEIDFVCTGELPTVKSEIQTLLVCIFFLISLLFR